MRYTYFYKGYDKESSGLFFSQREGGLVKTLGEVVCEGHF